MSARKTSILVRSIHGTAAVEWFLIFAIGTILVTRTYLKLTGYPQIGGGTLHIAHALWGGALMMFALIIGWLLLGSTPRAITIMLGGIGFGLFLDEVGKFVTKTNDYFYGPSPEIMYILVVLIVIIARVVRDFRQPTVAEALANAASIAADGVAHGLPPHRRSDAKELLTFAGERGADPALVSNIETLLDASVDTKDRLMRLQHDAAKLVPGFMRSPRWVTFFGWLIVVASIVTIILGSIGWFLKDRDLDDFKVYLELSGSSTADWILFVSGVITAALSIPAMIFRNRTNHVWPLRALRVAVLVFTMSNALVDFALDGFGALLNLAIGLLALILISYHLRLASAAASTRDERDELRL